MRFLLQRQLLINDMIFVAYELNLLLNIEKPHYRSQRAGEWSLIWALDSPPEKYKEFKVKVMGGVIGPGHHGS